MGAVRGLRSASRCWLSTNDSESPAADRFGRVRLEEPSSVRSRLGPVLNNETA